VSLTKNVGSARNILHKGRKVTKHGTGRSNRKVLAIYWLLLLTVNAKFGITVFDRLLLCFSPLTSVVIVGNVDTVEKSGYVYM